MKSKLSIILASLLLAFLTIRAVDPPARSAGGASDFLKTNGDASSITNVPVANAKSGSVLPGANGGGLVLLEQHAASTSASLDFTTCISSTYDEYQIDFLNLIPATNGALLWMRVSTDGGSTYVSTGSYSEDLWIWRAGGSTLQGGTGETKIVISVNTGQSNNSNWGITGRMLLFNPGSTSLFKQVQARLHHIDSSSLRVTVDSIGAYEATTAVNAFQFLFSTGNITSGTIRCYGVAKS